MMLFSIAPTQLILLVLPLWLLGTCTIHVNAATTRGKPQGFKCGPKSELHTYAFLDIQVIADPDPEELDQLGSAFGDMYNMHSSQNYCDRLFREVDGVDTTYFEQLDESTLRFILSIGARCVGCDETADLFSTSSSRRDLAPSDATRNLGGCSCPADLGEGTPSISEFTPFFGAHVDSMIQGGKLPSVLSLVQLVEIDPVPCGESKTEFRSEDQVSLGSAKADLSDMDLTALPEGFKKVYNHLQDGSCDSSFRRITSVEAVVVESRRRLQEAGAEGRDLQFNVLAFLLILNMVSRGTCFYCPSYLVLFDDAGRRQRELIERKQTGLCFCAAGSTKGTGPPSAVLMRKSLNNWLKDQRKAGVIQEKLKVEDIVQLDEEGKAAGIAQVGETAP